MSAAHLTTARDDGRRPALVIGYGNPLRRDDGFGWQVAQRLLDGAELEVEVEDRVVECRCGRTTVTADEMIGHVWACARCGHIADVDQPDDLTLIDLLVTPLDVPAGPKRREPSRRRAGSLSSDA